MSSQLVVGGSIFTSSTMLCSSSEYFLAPPPMPPAWLLRLAAAAVYEPPAGRALRNGFVGGGDVLREALAAGWALVGDARLAPLPAILAAATPSKERRRALELGSVPSPPDEFRRRWSSSLASLSLLLVSSWRAAPTSTVGTP